MKVDTLMCGSNSMGIEKLQSYTLMSAGGHVILVAK